MGNNVMDLVQAFIVYAEWIFFIAWGTLLAAVSAIAFGSDLVPNENLPNANRASGDKERPGA
jgi:hypothetical protein